MRNLAIAALLTQVVVLGACVQVRSDDPPLVVNVKSAGDECRVTVQRASFAQPFNFIRVNQAQLLQFGRETKSGRAILIYDLNAQYKCVGAAILTLQQAGLMVSPVVWDSR